MNVILLGQSWLASELLKQLVTTGRPPAAVCPDQPEDRLGITARGFGLPVIPFGDVPVCDLILAAHCHRFIPAETRALARHGVLAYHPSLLPRHRGRDAVVWTISFREAITGGTTYWMDDGADTGPIEEQRWCHVARDDTPASLWRRSLGPMGLEMMLDAVRRLEAGIAPRRTPQPEEYATWEPALKRPALKQG
jgi:methionyl-tRNA formyltransferase